ncbi:hypothetical protein FRB96_003638 [Tulasnella sp. 330]|nr:hypothetical protein FRB96_003638 [Tulasnella sp. 330]KAG8876411.1 hypothetical protein FRB97_004185 [Tulasnella sp. 331]
MARGSEGFFIGASLFALITLRDDTQCFKGVISTPSDTGTYQVERYATNTVEQAAYVVFPTDAEDISAAIGFARAEGLPLAIAGGRHHLAGSSSSKGGLVIDMRNMTGVRVDQERKVGYIQGGTTARRAVQELYKHSRSIPVGVCGSVGVIGLVIGGGIGYSTGQYGLACDNVVSATMVLANGDIVHVDEQENEDLLWGIKGGGSNFGVIAELGMRLHEPRSDVYHIEHLYVPEQLPALVAEINAWLEVQTPQEALILTFARAPQDGNPYLILGGVGFFDSEEGEQRWGRFMKLGPVVSKSEQIPYDKTVSLFDHADEILGPKIAQGGCYNNFDYEMVQRSFDIWLCATLIATSSIIVYEFWDYGVVSRIPVASTAYPLRTMDKVALICLMGFTDEVEAKKRCEEIRKCISSTSTDAAKNSVGYINYAHGLSADNTTDGNARRAFGTNYPRLQQLKRKYDPDMVFNKWFCIKPVEV